MIIMRRLAAVALAAAVCATAFVSAASATLFLLFKPTAATTGGLVSMRLGGTPATFTAADRVRPFKKPVRVYLVGEDVAATVRTRFDPRLRFVGELAPGPQRARRADVPAAAARLGNVRRSRLVSGLRPV